MFGCCRWFKPTQMSTGLNQEKATTILATSVQHLFLFKNSNRIFGAQFKAQFG